MSDIDQGLAEAAAPPVRGGRAAAGGATRAAAYPRPAAYGTDPPEEAELGRADDGRLVLLSQAGERAAFEELVRRTARLLFARLYLDTGDPHAAEDLVQETYLVAWRSVDQVTEPDGFRAWLLSVAHTVRIDAARREGRRKRSGPRAPGDPADALAGMADPAPPPDDAADRDEQRQRVLSLLRALPEPQRQVLTLRYLAGADYDAIARQLNLTNGSLRGLLNRGMARLRQLVGVLED